jgi:hypothetical protein
MDGIFIRDGRQHKRWGPERPTSKKEVKTMVETNPAIVEIEGTSWHGTPYSGPVLKAPDGEYHFVGPNPHIARNFYGTLVVSGGVPKVK